MCSSNCCFLTCIKISQESGQVVWYCHLLKIFPQFFVIHAVKGFAAAAAKLLQSCPTLCNPIDGSPPVSPIPGILHARTLEWVVISFSNAWKWKVKVKLLSRVRLFVTWGTVAYQASLSMGFTRQEYWSGLPFPSLAMQETWVQSLGWEDSLEKGVFLELSCFFYESTDVGNLIQWMFFILCGNNVLNFKIIWFKEYSSSDLKI